MDQPEQEQRGWATRGFPAREGRTSGAPMTLMRLLLHPQNTNAGQMKHPE
jgi:hypothetical protein